MLTLTNAKVFDGRQSLEGLQNVVVKDGVIASVEPASGAIDGPVFDLQGKTLMPGMISCHMHPDFYQFTIAQGMAGEPLGKEYPSGVMMAIAMRSCRVLLESGFTGYVGASCSNDIDAQLKIAIKQGFMQGPRIRACGHHIGTTGDLNDSPNWWRRHETPGTDVYADGPDDLRKLVREDLRRGAEIIKIFASDGHGFPSKTRRNMSKDEIATVVQTAHERGAKVRAHLADKAMIMECIELGVDVIDHGDAVDDECIDAMVQAGTFWVPSLIYPKLNLQLGWGDSLMQHYYDSVRAILPKAHKAGVKILVGDDYSGVFRDLVEDDPLDHQLGCYGREFAYYAELDGLSPADVLSWGTANAGELLDDMATVGVVEAGALADLIVIDGDPLADLSLLSQPESSLNLLMIEGECLLNRLNH